MSIFKTRLVVQKTLLAVLLTAYSGLAHAYLDPGTGSMLVYFIIGVFATILFTARDMLYRASDFFSGSRHAKGNAKKPKVEILFYSEGGQYWQLFQPVIANLNKDNIPCAYYTSDQQDPGLDQAPEGCNSLYVGKGAAAWVLLNRLEVTLVVMTTPQLDILQIKRSKGVKHYCHLVHSPTDALIYKKFAFDYFDSVMCSGTHQITSIRALESKRNLVPKQLLETGLPYYDTMLTKKNKATTELKQKQTKEKTLLLAPTWGNNGMLHRYGVRPVELLLQAGFNIILRPHPQTWKSEPKIVNEIIEPLRQKPNLVIDTDESAVASMQLADGLVSDISGIIFDYIFVFEKPVITIDSEHITGGLEAEDVAHQPWEFIHIEQLTKTVIIEDIEKLSEIVTQHIAKKNKKSIEIIRTNSLFNFGNAGEVAAKQLAEIVAEKP